MSVALEPCPFCGGKADFEEVAGPTVGASCSWSVGCTNEDVDCIGYQMLASFTRKCEAAAAWNKRAALPKGELAERLLEWIDDLESCTGPSILEETEARELAGHLRAAASLLGGGVPEGWRDISTALEEMTAERDDLVKDLEDAWLVNREKEDHLIAITMDLSEQRDIAAEWHRLYTESCQGLLRIKDHYVSALPFATVNDMRCYSEFARQITTLLESLEPTDGPLTPDDEAKIDKAWEHHKAAKPTEDNHE